MVDIKAWMEQYLILVNETFKERVFFVGLQGSYGRGEATKTSDIDIVLVLDKLSYDDLQIYQEMLEKLTYRHLICGFLSGKDELMNWEVADLFQFCYDTKPLQGSLDEVFSLIDEKAINQAIKMGACNLYHGCVHNRLHEKSEESLYSLYKAAVFVVQGIAFKQCGHYVSSQKQLLEVVCGDERKIVEIFLRFKEGEQIDFNEASKILFMFSKKWINKRWEK